MANYTSEVVVGSAIVAVLGIAAYIVAQPRPTPLLTAAFLSLQDPRRLFSIPATPNTQVYQWMEAVKEKNPNLLINVDAADLVVYKLKEPVPVLEAQNELPNRWNDLSASCVQMNSGMHIGYYIQNPPADHVHVIVKIPSGNKTISPSNSDVITQQQTNPDILRMRQEASTLHDKAWGKEWPRSRDTISKAEIFGNGSDSVDDVDDVLADKLEVPPDFNYWYYKEIQYLKEALGIGPSDEFKDVLVVRNEYEMLLKALTTELSIYHGIVVTGQPGIGKSTFLLYLLLHRLENRLPTAVQFDSKYYFIFDEQGAIVHRVSNRDPRLRECWALADSNETVREPCEAFSKLSRFIILASSPQPERWKEWEKQREGCWIVSDLPSVPEIAAIVKEINKRQLELKNDFVYDPSSTLSLVRKWGPSTRNIIRSMKCATHGKADPIEKGANDAVIRIWNKASTTLPASLNIIPQSDGSSVIFLRRAQNLPDGSVAWAEPVHFIPTPHLRDLFEKQRIDLKNEPALNLFNALSSHAFTRGAAGWAHECQVHKRLLGIGGADLIIFSKNAQKTMPSSTLLLHGTLGGLQNATGKNSFYWRPDSGNFPGVDGVLGDIKGHVYTIQATIANKHTSPKQGILKVWESFPKEIRASCTWHCVVITDSKKDAETYVETFSEQLSGFTLGRTHVGVQVWACALPKSTA